MGRGAGQITPALKILAVTRFSHGSRNNRCGKSQTILTLIPQSSNYDSSQAAAKLDSPAIIKFDGAKADADTMPRRVEP
jgi:hypothetical protein